jgi:hypothetical protein
MSAPGWDILSGSSARFEAKIGEALVSLDIIRFKGDLTRWVAWIHWGTKNRERDSLEGLERGWPNIKPAVKAIQEKMDDHLLPLQVIRKDVGRLRPPVEAARVARRFIKANSLDAGAEYLSAKLTPMARQKLLRAFPAIHKDLRADHMTVWYDPPDHILEQLEPLIGKKVRLKVVGYAEDDKGQAVAIDTRLPTKGRIPHVTVSVGGGVKAVYSNNLLANGYQRVVGPTLDAVLTIDQ